MHSEIRYRNNLFLFITVKKRRAKWHQFFRMVGKVFFRHTVQTVTHFNAARRTHRWVEISDGCQLFLVVECPSQRKLQQTLKRKRHVLQIDLVRLENVGKFQLYFVEKCPATPKAPKVNTGHNRRRDGKKHRNSATYAVTIATKNRNIRSDWQQAYMSIPKRSWPKNFVVQLPQNSPPQKKKFRLRDTHGVAKTVGPPTELQYIAIWNPPTVQDFFPIQFDCQQSTVIL